MAAFKGLNTKALEQAKSQQSPDSIYWKKLGESVLVKEYGPIDYVDFSPIEPYPFAVTCSVRVQVYNPVTKLGVKNFSRFRESAYGAVFRGDGRLLCAGGEEKCLKLFDVSTKEMLRLFKGHEGPVHRVQFMVENQLASFSDDKTVKLWDISTEQIVNSWSGHTDYVRAGAVNSCAPDIVLSGSYDGHAQVYDTRAEVSSFTVDHGNPIQSVLFLPNGGLFLTAGGTTIKIWDTLMGGKLLGCLSRHHKTITCLRLASDNKRLLSSSLDRHVNVYDLSTFSVVHTLEYPNGILSLGISPNDDTLVAGLVDGLVAIRRREASADELAEEDRKKNVIAYRFRAYAHHAEQADLAVKDESVTTQPHYDKHLRKFQYRKALNDVMLPYITRNKPHTTVAVLQELMRRKALGKALQRQSVQCINKLLSFIIHNVADLKFSKILIEAAHETLDTCCADNTLCNDKLLIQIKHLKDLIRDEMGVIHDLSELHGSLQMILGAAATDQVEVNRSAPAKHIPLEASKSAQKSFVVNIS